MSRKCEFDITFHPSWWHKYAGIDFSEKFFTDPEYRMECDVKMRRTLYDYFGKYGLGEENPQKRPILGTDLLAAGYFHSALAGCDIIYQPDNSPQVVCKGLDEETIEEYEIGDVTKHPLYVNMEEQISYLMDQFGYVEPCINLMGIQNVAMDLMGQELMISYYTAPDEAEELLQKITDMSILIGKRLKELSEDISGGVTAIVRKDMPACYLTSNCSVEMISQELYEEFLLKYDQQLAEAFGNFGIHHCGQTMEHVVEGYSKINHFTFAEVGAGSDLQKVREALPHVFLNARYAPTRLLSATEEEMATEIEALYVAGKGDGGFSISCVGIDSTIPNDKISIFLEKCCEKLK